jgi:hypothetical protein
MGGVSTQDSSSFMFTYLSSLKLPNQPDFENGNELEELQ